MFERDWNEDGWNDKDRDSVNYDLIWNVNLLVNQITQSIPSKPINIKFLNLPQNIELADPIFHQPQDVELLLGATIFWDVRNKSNSVGI